MENFDNFIRNKSQYKEARSEKYKHDSKDRLSKILKKKVEKNKDWEEASIEDIESGKFAGVCREIWSYSYSAKIYERTKWLRTLLFFY